MSCRQLGFSLLYELNAPSDKFKVFSSVVPWSRKIAAENCPAQYENSEHSKNKRIVKAGYANSDKMHVLHFVAKYYSRPFSKQEKCHVSVLNIFNGYCVQLNSQTRTVNFDKLSQNF